MNKFTSNKQSLQNSQNISTIETNKLDRIYKEPKINQLLINFIYDKLRLENFNYNELTYKKDLNLLTNSNYLIMPNYIGILCLLVFMRNHDRFYSFLIDKNTLGETKDKTLLENVRIYPIRINLNYRIYDGSIFEGICFFKERKPTLFIMNDMYYFQGEKQFNELLKYKLMKFDIYLKKYQSDKEQFKIYTNKYFTMDKIEDAKEFLNRQKVYSKDEIKPENLNVTGLIFYPFLSSSRFIFNNKKQINKVDNTKQIKNKVENITSSPVLTQNIDEYKIIDSTKKIKLKFIMKKTSESDSYKLFLINNVISSGDKQAYKTKFIDYAYITTTEESLKWHNIFNETTTKIVECIYNTNKNKWIPQNISESKTPNFINEFLKYFQNNN